MEPNQIRNARDKVTRRAGGKQGGRFTNKRALALEVLRLTEEGKTNRDIALIIQRSERYVRELRSFAKQEQSALGYEIPDPRGLEDLSPEGKALVQPYWDWFDDQDDPAKIEAVTLAFKAFFDRFSGRLLPEHMLDWVRQAFTHKRLLLNVPPRHGKSTVMSVWLPMYLVCCDRNIQILIVSKTAEFAVKFCMEIAVHFEEDTAMIEMFGRFVPQNQSWTWSPGSGRLVVEGRTRLVMTGDLTIQIRGARTQILGMEADWEILDDPDDPDTVASETQRQRARDWVDEQVITRMNPGGHFVAIGQRLGINDLYGWLAKKRVTRIEGQPPLYKHINRPAVLDWETHETLWPEEWDFERLMTERYEDLGYAKFECLYQQNPMPVGARLVQPNWIEGDDSHVGCLDRNRPIGVGWGATFGPTRNAFGSVRVISWDPSPTRYHGIVVADVVYNTAQFTAGLIHIESKIMQARESIARMDQLITMYRPDYLIIEDSAVSKWILQDPWYDQIKSRVRVLSHRTTASTKGDPAFGIQSLAVDFEFGRIRLPWGDPEARAMVMDFLEKELYVWPEGEIDDRLMALWFIKYSHRALIPMGELVTRMPWGDGGAWNTTGLEDAWA